MAWPKANNDELISDLRRLVQAGYTPKTGPYAPDRMGWSEDTWNAARRLGIKLKNVHKYSERLGPIREIVKTLCEQEQVPHEGFAKTSLGGAVQDMIHALAVFHWAYNRFPNPEPNKQLGHLGWSKSDFRSAEAIGQRLASVSKYRYWCGSLDEALLLANQVIFHGEHGQQPVTGERSVLNVAPQAHNKLHYIQALHRRPNWKVRNNQNVVDILPVREASPKKPVEIERIIPLGKIDPPPVREELPPVQPQQSTSGAFTIQPKFPPGCIVMIPIGKGQMQIGQIAEINVAITRAGNEFVYKVTSRNAQATFRENQLLGVDDLLGAFADLVSHAEANPDDIASWNINQLNNPLLG